MVYWEADGCWEETGDGADMVRDWDKPSEVSVV